ncbi:cytochrome C biogenesis protein [Halovivax sp.]|uniref:cytochrome C biogenesis protein n=1 Tax=Halovivax sp. TaxID=1935978 RepID=UPI0025B9266D|nr:cytochrome C biogenesis protein [Halovivax sp.]
MAVGRFVELFLIGVATPLTAACVIPLYPAFLAFLADRGDAEGGPSIVALGALVTAGVLACMALIGLVFSAVLQTSLTRVVETVSHAAFAVLAVVGAILLLDLGVFSRLPAIEPPHSAHPSVSAFGYGFFFGAIVLPCNPALIALFFARVPILFDSRLESFLGFLAFGAGIGAPLLAFSLVSQPFARQVTRTLARYSGPVNRVTGGIVLAIAAYYLVVVFAVVDVPTV